MINFDTENLKYFLEIAHEGGMSAASRKLHISQPSLSNRMSMLEESLGVQLFDRRKGKIQLTALGKEYLHYVEIAFAAIEQGNQLIERHKEELGQNLCIVDAANAFPPEIVERIAEKHPGASVSHQLQSSQDVIRNLIAGEAGIGLSLYPVEDDAVSCKEVLTERFVAIYHRTHKFTGHKLIELKEIAGTQLVGSYLGTDYKKILLSHCDAEHFVPDIVYQTTDGKSLSGPFLSGHGIVVLPMTKLLGKRWLDAPQGGHVANIVSDNCPCTSTIYLICNKALTAGLAMNDLIALIQQHFSQMRRAAAELETFLNEETDVNVITDFMRKQYTDFIYQGEMQS